MKVSLKSTLLKTVTLLIALIGIIEYTKIGLSLVDGTYTKKFITVSPFSKGAGEVDSLPPDILDIRSIIERNNLTAFSLRFSSEDEGKILFITARTIEFLYPTRVDEKSRFVILIGEQQLLNNCKIIDKLQKITLYECIK
jgi:hypothetical protein